MLAVLAAFFCLLFFAAAKKSRCRPAQGRRLKREGKTRMPAKRPRMPAKRQNADASANQSRPTSRRRQSRCRPAQGRRMKREGKARMPAKTQANQPAVADKARVARKWATLEAQRQSADARRKPKQTNQPSQTNQQHYRRASVTILTASPASTVPIIHRCTTSHVGFLARNTAIDPAVIATVELTEMLNTI